MFIDSVIWIALKYSRDSWHSKAFTLKDKISKLKLIYITDFVIIETYNFLLRKTSPSVAQKTLEMFLNSSKIKILYNDEVSLRATQVLLKNYPNLSITDANLVWYSQILNIETIMSFDSGFDEVKSIKRVFN